MTKKVPAASILTVAVFAIGVAMAEDQTAPSPEEVRGTIRMMEKSVTDSSVTHLYTAEQRDAKLELLTRADAEANQGHVDAAMALVEQAGRMLYPMEMQDEVVLEGEKRLEWLEKISAVTEAILPAAYSIAEEKGASTGNLDRISRQRDEGLAAWEAGNVDQAETLIITAYNLLQSEVASLRSGDLLTIALPSNDTREAWEEAERRYLDWRFTADWMEQSGAALGADPETIANGSRLAEEIYQEARAYAAQGKWAAAVKTIDKAYAVMEEHWRMAGIDI